MLSYSLNKNIDGQVILTDIQKLVNDKILQYNSPESLVLVIDIKQVTENISFIPKLEYKQLDQ